MDTPSATQTESRYSDETYRNLMAEFTTLASFSEVASWDKRAADEIEKMHVAATGLASRIESESTALAEARRKISEKSFLGRIFANRDEERRISSCIKACQQCRSLLEKYSAELQEAIDFTPNTAEEKKQLMQELRSRKKELQLRKRELAAAMKAIRVDARQQSSEAGKIFGIFYASKLAASQRRSIRYSKEALLQPRESEKQSIERQILQVDRDIMWVEKFNS